MSLKYVFTMGESRLPRYQRFDALAHVPIDNVMLTQLERFSPPRLGCPWSRLDDYTTYLTFQEWFRAAFPGSAPLAVEFRLWLGASGAHGQKAP